jgi:hypothetical protein
MQNNSDSVRERSANLKHMQRRVSLLHCDSRCCCWCVHTHLHASWLCPERELPLWFGAALFTLALPLACMKPADTAAVYGCVLHRFYNCDGDTSNGCEVQAPPNTFIQCKPGGGFTVAGCALGYVSHVSHCRLRCQWCCRSAHCYRRTEFLLGNLVTVAV